MVTNKNRIVRDIYFCLHQIYSIVEQNNIKKKLNLKSHKNRSDLNVIEMMDNPKNNGVQLSKNKIL
jgi:hypothetical protein